MIFLAIARATTVGFVNFGGHSINDSLAIMHTAGDRGILQPKTAEVFVLPQTRSAAQVDRAIGTEVNHRWSALPSYLT